MDAEYLRRGIVGLSRSLDSVDALAHSDRGWFAGHWPCAVIAAYYFCRDNPIEPGVDQAVSRQIDRLMARHAELFAPPEADTSVEARSLDDIVQALQGSITQYVVAGHNTIYAAYALRALSDQSEWATPFVWNRIHALIAYFAGRHSLPYQLSPWNDNLPAIWA